MTISPLDRIASPVPTPDRIGQGTAVEQSRAVAQVLAAVRVAQDRPRSVNDAIARMREVCAIQSLADRAFFRYARGGEQVTGASVHLARELARVWGNIDYGIAELRRDDVAGQSEMIAYAWDLETNARLSNTFIVPHIRTSRAKGVTRLEDPRDIYESNANSGARRLREQIFGVLPKWFTEEAQDLCRQTLAGAGGDKPMATRVADMVAAFKQYGVTAQQLEEKLGRDSEQWTPPDLATLRVIGQSLKAGETTVDAEFGAAGLTADDILSVPAKSTRRSKAAPEPAPATPYADAGDDDGYLPMDGAEAAAEGM